MMTKNLKIIISFVLGIVFCISLVFAHSIFANRIYNDKFNFIFNELKIDAYDSLIYSENGCKIDIQKFEDNKLILEKTGVSLEYKCEEQNSSLCSSVDVKIDYIDLDNFIFKTQVVNFDAEILKEI